MTVELYNVNQVNLNFYVNPIKQIQTYFSSNRPVTEDLIKLVDQWLQFYFRKHQKRYLHSISTADTAEEIARIVGYINPAKAKLVGMIHDIAKTPAKKIMKKASKEKIEKLNKNLENIGIKLLEPELIFHETKKDNVKSIHAPLGRIMAEKKLCIQDNEILNAIRYHTFGLEISNLDMLSKIIILADKIEPVKRGYALYNEIIDILIVTKNPDIALNALRNKLQQAA